MASELRKSPTPRVTGNSRGERLIAPLASPFPGLKSFPVATGNLGAHLKSLRDRGYVTEKKKFRGGKPNTSYRITAAGREALTVYLDHLASLVSGRAEIPK